MSNLQGHAIARSRYLLRCYRGAWLDSAGRERMANGHISRAGSVHAVPLPPPGHAAPSPLRVYSGRRQVELRWQPRYRLRWAEGFSNIVVTTGLNELLTRCFKTIPGDVLWYVALKDAGVPAAGDTMASHAGWAEITGYTEGTRPAWTPGAVAAGSVDNTAAKASFSINADDDLFGACLTDDNTKGGSSGTLYGVADFTTGVVTGATQANPVVITSTAHGLVNGNRVRLQSLGGMTEVNDLIFTVANVTANTFELSGEDGTGHTAYTSGGTWSKVRTVENGDTLDVSVTLSVASA